MPKDVFEAIVYNFKRLIIKSRMYIQNKARAFNCKPVDVSEL